MHCLEAENILKERCPQFYDSLVEEYPEGFPLEDDSFEDDNLSGRKHYWEKQLQDYCRKTTHSQYAVYLCAELNAFTFFVGAKLFPENPEVAVKLGNYSALRKTFSEETAGEMARFYPQAVDILLAKIQIEKLRQMQTSSEGFAEQVTKTLYAIDRAVEYDTERYEAYVAHDSSLKFDGCEIIKDLLARQLIQENQLEGTSIGYLLNQRAIMNEQKVGVTSLTSAL